MRRHNKKHRTIRKSKAGPHHTGQHLLHNPGTVRQLIETIRIQPTDTVLEIGAGKGVLTVPLAEKAGKVIAVEVDGDFVQLLQAKAVDYPQIKVIQGDIREIALPGSPFCVVANIPFAITTAILVKLLGAEGKAFQRGALIMEKGAARRFTEAATQDPRLLTWRMNFLFEMRREVPRAHFAPPPRVDAAIVRIVRKDRPLLLAKDTRRFTAFATYVLGQPRLSAANAMKGIFTPAQLTTVLKNARVDREQSAVTLTPEQWAALFYAMLQHTAPYRWP